MTKLLHNAEKRNIFMKTGRFHENITIFSMIQVLCHVIIRKVLIYLQYIMASTE